MDLNFDLSPRENEVYQPQLLACLQEFTKTAEEMGHKFPRSIAVLNTTPDTHIDGYYPRKRIRLALGGKEFLGESTFLGYAGSDAAELTETSVNIDFCSKGMESMNGPSNDALCYAVRVGSSKPINLCIEEQDYIGSINLVQDYLDKINNIVKSGGSQDVLKAAVSAMEHVTDMLTVFGKVPMLLEKEEKGP